MDANDFELLLVQDTAVLARTVSLANDLLACRRRAGDAPGRILGLWQRPALDNGLPFVGGAGDGAGFRLEFSAGCAGVWALCRLRGGAPGPDSDGPEAPLQAVLEDWWPRLGDGERAGHCLWPVFPQALAAAAGAAARARLQARFPSLIAGDWFVQAPDGGLAPAGG